MAVALNRFWAIAARVMGLPLWAGLAPAHAAPAPTDPYPLEAAGWGPEAGNGPLFQPLGRGLDRQIAVPSGGFRIG